MASPTNATPFYQADLPNFDGTGFSPEAWFDGIGAITLAALGGDINVSHITAGWVGFGTLHYTKLPASSLGFGRMVREAKATPPLSRSMVAWSVRAMLWFLMASSRFAASRRASRRVSASLWPRA